MPGKTVAVDEDTLKRLGRSIHRTIDEWRKISQQARAAVLCGVRLRHSLPRALILRAITSKGQATVRELKQATHNAKVSARDWDNALAALCASGEIAMDVDGKTGKKTVWLVTKSHAGTTA